MISPIFKNVPEIIKTRNDFLRSFSLLCHAWQQRFESPVNSPV
jgi:hypothetical protein